MKNQLINFFLMNDKLLTYDPYDIWKTKAGIYVKQLYYKNKYLGLIPAALFTLYDMFINNNLRFGYTQQEYPIARAQASLALLNMYKEERNEDCLKYAKKHIDWLIENTSRGYSGYCWGLNFDWVYTAEKVYDSNTPFSTHTPYPLEAMVEYYNILTDKDDELHKVITSVFLFLENDIQIMREDANMLIVSYGAEKDRIVTNANAYVMYMYAMLIQFLPHKREYIETKIYKIYNFLCSVQNTNGSWIYQPYDSDSFIDCFHSAFVIKNIYKTNKLINLENSDHIVKLGYNYIINHFLDKKYGLFRRFSQSNKLSLVKFDLYDNAEMLSLSALLDKKDIVNMLVKSIERNFCLNGNIYSTIDIFSLRHNKNHLRWATVPYLYGLTNIKE